MKAWHFLNSDRCLGYGDNRLVEPGQTLQQPDMEREPELCCYGMHASQRIVDALKYAPGPIVCRVEIPDPIVGDDKIVGRERTVLWMVDASTVLHEFACRCAEDVLALVDNPDPRSLAAIEAKRRWLRGEATDSELAAAQAAAWAAGAAAWAAAWDAARAAAWAAARAAARAAGDAAGATARNAAHTRQNRRLTSMVIAEARRQGVYW